MQNTLVNASGQPATTGKIKGQAELAKNLIGWNEAQTG
jgi:hypothetical protein